MGEAGTNERAAALAERYERAYDAVIATVEGCPEARWTAICADTGWPVNVQAHHIAQVMPFLVQVCGAIARGAELTPLPMAAVDAENAQHALAHADVTKGDVLAALRSVGPKMLLFIRGLSDAHLDRAGVFINEIPAMPVEAIIGKVAVGELANHGGAMRAAIGPTPAVLAPGAGESLWFLSTRMDIKAAREQTGGAFSVIEVTHPPGFATPVHVHHSEDEWFYVLEGNYVYFCGDTTLHAGAGAFVTLPRDLPHAFRVESAGGGRVLQLTSPSGVEGFFREAGTPAAGPGLPPRTPIDMERLRSLEAKYGNEHLGPPPQREE